MTTHLSGSDLLDAVSATGMENSNAFVNGVSASFDSTNEETVSNAQRVLLDNGYRIESTEMVEGHFYLFKFRSPGSRYPYGVVLRYLNRSQFTPQLGRFYYDGRTLIRSNTDKTRAFPQTVRPLDGMTELLFERTYYWIPLLRNSPFTDLYA